MLEAGCEVVLLSGDLACAVGGLAAALAIEHVRTELLPEERAREVIALRAAGPVVAAVGRSGEDAHILAAADIAIVLGCGAQDAGSDAVTVVSDDLRDAALALTLGKALHLRRLWAVRVAGVLFASVVAGAAFGWVTPPFAALASLVVDGYCLGIGGRLRRRFALRLATHG
jgi:Cu+-exporting ATPase